MGVNASNQRNDSLGASTMIVVNEVNSVDKPTNDVSLPNKAKPITLNRSSESSNPKLSYDPLTDLIRGMERFFHVRSELISVRQANLQRQIVILDGHVQQFTDSYVKDKHKALAKMNDNSKKIIQVKNMLQKSTYQTELCVRLLNHLNNNLPENRRLEPLT